MSAVTKKAKKDPSNTRKPLKSKGKAFFKHRKAGKGTRTTGGLRRM